MLHSFILTKCTKKHQFCSFCNHLPITHMICTTLWGTKIASIQVPVRIKFCLFYSNCLGRIWGFKRIANPSLIIVIVHPMVSYEDDLRSHHYIRLHKICIWNYVNIPWYYVTFIHIHAYSHIFTVFSFYPDNSYMWNILSIIMCNSYQYIQHTIHEISFNRGTCSFSSNI